MYEALPPPRATRIRLGRIGMFVLALIVLVGMAYTYLMYGGGLTHLQTFVDRDGIPGPSWLNGSIQYPVEREAIPVKAVERDLNAEELYGFAMDIVHSLPALWRCSP